MKVLSALTVLVLFPIAFILFGLAIGYWGVPTVLIMLGIPLSITTIIMGFNGHITIAKYIHSRIAGRRYKRDMASFGHPSAKQDELAKYTPTYSPTPGPPMQEIDEDPELESFEVILKVNADGSEVLVNSTTGEVLSFNTPDEYIPEPTYEEMLSDVKVKTLAGKERLVNTISGEIVEYDSLPIAIVYIP